MVIEDVDLPNKHHHRSPSNHCSNLHLFVEDEKPVAVDWLASKLLAISRLLLTGAVIVLLGISKRQPDLCISEQHPTDRSHQSNQWRFTPRYARRSSPLIE